MNTQPIKLIVGADGFIGKALMEYLKLVGERVIGTTRRRNTCDDSRVYLDLSCEVEGWDYPGIIDLAVICAGVVGLEPCYRNPVTSFLVNVEGTTKLVRNLVAKGAFVIYISSNQVFDGSVPYRKPNDSLSPITEYGRQKAETERRISQWADSVAIVRFSKVLGPGIPLFLVWRESLINSEVIHPFSDIVIAPIPLSCAILVLRLIADKRLSGITQVSGNYDVSYAEIAYRCAKLLGMNSRLVQPIKARESGFYKEAIPMHTTLDMERLRSKLGIEPPDVWWTIEKMFLEPSLLGNVNLLEKEVCR